MSDKQRINVAPPAVLEGNAEELAQQLAERFVLELAVAVAKVHGEQGLFEYYTALTTCVLCQARIALGPDLAELIGTECTKGALSADAPSSIPGVH